MVLVREDRVAAQAELLGAFDLSVPIRALDEADHEAQAVRACDARNFVDDFERARLVSLHCQAETAPLRKLARDARRERVQHVEREFEAVAFFGVDRQVDVGPSGRLDQLPDARQQLGEHALALRVLIARKQRTELDRDAVGHFRPGGVPGARNRTDRIQVGREVALRIGFGAGALAEHVVAEAQALQAFARARGFGHRLLDRTTEHELAAEQLDRANRRGDDRLRAQALQDAAFGFVLREEALRQRNRAGRQVREHLVRAACPGSGIARSLLASGIEVGLAELIGSERNRGLGIGHAQQRFGQTHQREAFGAGDRVLLQQ